ncbi:MAG: hypothetical protein ABIH00_09300 [Armatimonadota bacterium]
MLKVDDKKKDIVIITNSPGELSSWVRITIAKLKLSRPEIRIIVMLVPCPYASGKEEEIAKAIDGVDVVINPKEFVQFLFGFRLKKYSPAAFGSVVFLGGDFWHALIVSRRLRYPSVAYSVKASKWNKYFDYLGVQDEAIAQEMADLGFKKDRIVVVGNLMVEQAKPTLDKLAVSKQWGIEETSHTVGILPGSRFYHVKESLPYYLKVAEELKDRFSNIQFLLGVSPFLSLKDLEKCLTPSGSGLEGTKAELITNNGSLFIKTEKGLKVRVLQGMQYDVINLSDLVLTIPGTNTAEVAALGKPMIVSSTWRAKIPRGGLTGFLGSLPMGSFFRKKLLYWILKRIKFTALPNQIADKEIVPEVIVEQKAEEVTNVAAELLKNDDVREKMSHELIEVTKGKHDASTKIAELILSSLDSSVNLFANAHKIRTPFREFVFGWRGWILAPLAVFVLFIARPTLYSFLFGLIFVFGGEFLRIWGVGYAGSTTRESELMAPQLVTAGPYAYIKNPLYLGNCVTALGFYFMAIGGMLSVERVIVLMLFLMGYMVVYGIIIPLEEVYLYETFGEPYLIYAKMVPRIIPNALRPYFELQGRFNWQVIFKAEIHTLAIIAAMMIIMALMINRDASIVGMIWNGIWQVKRF